MTMFLRSVQHVSFFGLTGSNKCLTSSNKKLLVTSALLLVQVPY